MALELDYDRSLHEKEHQAGPFEVTKEEIQAFSQGIGETNPIYVDEAAAQSQGYRSLVAPSTFCTILVHRVALPDINLKFGQTQMHAGQRVQSRARLPGGVLSRCTYRGASERWKPPGGERAGFPVVREFRLFGHRR